MKIFAVVFAHALLALCVRSAVIQDGISSFITNGDTENGIVPFFGYLEIFHLNTAYFGGSALISRTAAVTVAQNVYGFTSWRVGFGGNRITDLSFEPVQTAIHHPEYNNRTLINNIAVLIFTRPIIPSPTIAPLSMPPFGANFPLTQTIGSIVGFGFGQTDQQPLIIQTATFRVLSQVECGNFYGHLVQENQLQNYFCAVDPNGVANICAGDQGGAIYSRQLNVIFGLASFIRDDDCNSPNAAPAAFIRLSEYFNWLAPYLD